MLDIWLETKANKANPWFIYLFFNIYIYICIDIAIVQNSLNNIHPVLGEIKPR